MRALFKVASARTVCCVHAMLHGSMHEQLIYLAQSGFNKNWPSSKEQGQKDDKCKLQVDR